MKNAGSDLDFRPVPKPGRDRIVDPPLLQFIKTTIARCEWPLGCTGRAKLDALAAHHIFGRGSGGGKRNDHPYGVAVLCPPHHNMGPGEYAHHALWWNREGQERLQRHIKKTRKPEEWQALWAYMQERGFAVPEFIPVCTPVDPQQP